MKDLTTDGNRMIIIIMMPLPLPLLLLTATPRRTTPQPQHSPSAEDVILLNSELTSCLSVVNEHNQARTTSELLKREARREGGWKKDTEDAYERDGKFRRSAHQFSTRIQDNEYRVIRRPYFQTNRNSESVGLKNPFSAV